MKLVNTIHSQFQTRTHRLWLYDEDDSHNGGGGHNGGRWWCYMISQRIATYPRVGQQGLNTKGR